MASFTPIINAALDQNLTGLDFLLERKDISRIQKIEALELAGAAILIDTKHAGLFPKAFDYWRKSLHLRLMDTVECGPIIKKLPDNLKKTGRIVEWATEEELERAIQNQSEHEIQSFLVRSRILSTISWNAVKPLFADYIFADYGKRSIQLLVEGRYIDWLHIQWSMLEIIRRFHASENGLWLTTLKVVHIVCVVLEQLYMLNDHLLNANTIEISLELILATDQFHLKDREFVADDQLSSHLFHMFSLFEILAAQPELINKESKEFLSQLVLRKKRRDPFNGRSLLNMACFISSFRSGLATIELLLRCGADPNAGDESDGYGPLHYLARFCSADDDATAKLLLSYGAHLDRFNKKRKTAAVVWMEFHAENTPMPGWLREDSAPRLICLCARVIRSYGVPYYAKLPRVLRYFVKLH